MSDLERLQTLVDNLHTEKEDFKLVYTNKYLELDAIEKHYFQRFNALQQEITALTSKINASKCNTEHS